jgi:hypothetical protein
MVPKLASPEELGKFWSISLCNVIYKISTKVVANMLKKVPEVYPRSNLSLFLDDL